MSHWVEPRFVRIFRFRGAKALASLKNAEVVIVHADFGGRFQWRDDRTLRLWSHSCAAGRVPLLGCSGHWPPCFPPALKSYRSLKFLLLEEPESCDSMVMERRDTCVQRRRWAASVAPSWLLPSFENLVLHGNKSPPGGRAHRQRRGPVARIEGKRLLRRVNRRTEDSCCRALRRGWHRDFSEPDFPGRGDHPRNAWR